MIVIVIVIMMIARDELRHEPDRHRVVEEECPVMKHNDKKLLDVVTVSLLHPDNDHHPTLQRTVVVNRRLLHHSFQPLLLIRR